MASAASPANDAATTTPEASPKTSPTPKHPRVPQQLEAGPRIESRDLEKMLRRLRRWQRQPKAAITWSAAAVLAAELRGANHKNSRVYRKAKTLAHSAGLVVPPKPGDDDLAKKRRGPSRAFFYAQAELEEFGAIARVHINQRDERLLDLGVLRCSHMLRSRCGCAWNKGLTIVNVLVQSDRDLARLEKAQIRRAGLVLVRKPRGALNTPRCTEIPGPLPASENVPDRSGNTAPGEPANDAPPRCTENDVSVHADVGPDLTSRCISLSVSTNLNKIGSSFSAAGSVGARRSARDSTDRPCNGLDDAPTAPEVLVSTLGAPHGPSNDAHLEVDAPPARAGVASASHAAPADGFAAGDADGFESTEGRRARAVPPRPPAAAGLAVLAEHRRCLRQDGPPTQHELLLACEALRLFTAAELSEAWAGAAASPWNATRGLYRSARWLLANPTRIQACIDYARDAAARRAAGAAARERMAAAPSSAGGPAERTVAVKIHDGAALAAQRKAEIAKAAQLRFEFDHAGGPGRERIAAEYRDLVGTEIEADIARDAAPPGAS